ncbi:hypothetical protein ACPC54_18370 [Kitasatospora sp. NPDC094028]
MNSAPESVTSPARTAESRMPRFWPSRRRENTPPPSMELNCVCGARIAATGLVGVLAARAAITRHQCPTEDGGPKGRGEEQVPSAKD